MSKPEVNKETQYFESIFAVAHDSIVFVDHEGIILRVNPAFTKIFGYEEHEILGKLFYILEHKDEVMQKNMSQQPLINFYRTEKSNLEMTLFDKQGGKVSVRFRSAFIKDTHGHNAEIIGMIERIPEQTDTDKVGDSLAEKSWEAQQNFDNVLNNSADAIAICGVDGNIMMASKFFSEMLDYTQEELIGKHIVEFTAYLEGRYPTTTGEEVTIDKEYVACTSSRLAELYEKEHISNWEFYVVRRDEVHVPVEATLSVLKDKDGERRGLIVILRDITERKRVEKERKQDENKLIEAKEHLDNIIESSLDAIVVSDEIGNITRVNKFFLEKFCYREEEIVGKHMVELTPMNKEGTYESITGELIYVGKEYNDNASAMVSKFLEEGQVTNWEDYYFNKGEKLVPVEQNIVCLYNNDGERTGAVAIIRDITERKEMQDKLFHSKKIKVLGELAGGVAHDFNNVLAAILGRAQLLKMIFDSPPSKKERRKSVLELKKSLEVIKRASLDGAETVRRIQEFSRRRDDDRYFTSVDMNKIIDNALEFTKLNWKNGAESKGIKINIKKEFSTLPSVAGSAAELREVLTNLVASESRTRASGVTGAFVVSVCLSKILFL